MGSESFSTTSSYSNFMKTKADMRWDNTKTESDYTDSGRKGEGGSESVFFLLEPFHWEQAVKECL